MARLERGKGKRMQVTELSQHGRVLRSRERHGDDLRLPGYRRCASEADARRSLEEEVRVQVADGMRPADDDTRAIAAAMRPAKKDAPPAFPIRRDLAIYNEAKGFIATARRMAGKPMQEGSDAWRKAVMKGDLLPMTLVQDDPFLIRVVAGDALTAEEQEEWVARLDWHLNISDGKLCITGGSIFAYEDYDDGDPYYEQYVGQVDVPKGRYRATLYSQLHGINGSSVLDHVAGGRYGAGEEAEAFWARTRAGAAPKWMDEELIGFLLHLEPIEKAPTSGLAELPEEGWFGGAEEARKPERCPRGLPARDVVRKRTAEQGSWTYVRDVHEMFGDGAPQPIKGGKVAVPVAAIEHAAQLAFLASRWTAFELRVTDAKAKVDVAALEWPEGIIAVVEDGVGRLLLDSDRHGASALTAIASAAPPLGGLPSGTRLELVSAPAGAIEGEPGDEGRMRYAGTLRDGTWEIEGAWPTLEADRLRDALTFAAKVPVGEDITQHVAIFTQRFGDVWTVTPAPAPEEDDEPVSSAPIKGAFVWTSPAGRSYHVTMALMISEDLAGTAQAKERSLIARGYAHVGDLLCDDFENVAVRGYAQAGGDLWGFLLCAAPDMVLVQLVSMFDGNAMLVTSNDREPRERVEEGIYRTGEPASNTRELLDSHAARLATLAPTRGAPIGTGRDMKAFAEALDRVIDATS